MALGGGTFTTQNKVLPGAYVNVVSASRASATLGDRGVVAMPIALSWGNSGEVITVTAEEFIKNSMKIFGYTYDAAEMQPFREVFKHAQKVHVYNLADGTGHAKASCNYCTAKKAGVVGNEMMVVIQKNIDDESKFDVSLVLQRWVSDPSGNMKSVTYTLDEQTVASVFELTDNDYVTWNTETDLAVTAGTPLINGGDGKVDSLSYQKALNALESYNYNVLICPDASAIDLYVAFTKRMRDNVGVKFQTVIPAVTDPDYEGVVQLPEVQAGAIYWAAGALAGCAINKSCTNMLYDGELTLSCLHTQSELETCIQDGVFVFHKVEDETRVLVDINSFVSVTDEKNDLFCNNQTIRVIDERSNTAASIFNTKYLGKVQNDASGRVSFWGDLVTHAKQMESMRAIETYDTESLTVEQGEKKGSVVTNEALTIIGTMEKLYLTSKIN